MEHHKYNLFVDHNESLITRFLHEKSLLSKSFKRQSIMRRRRCAFSWLTYSICELHLWCWIGCFFLYVWASLHIHRCRNLNPDIIKYNIIDNISDLIEWFICKKNSMVSPKLLYVIVDTICDNLFQNYDLN